MLYDIQLPQRLVSWWSTHPHKNVSSETDAAFGINFDVSTIGPFFLNQLYTFKKF